jgi:hypothetical protein
MEIITKLISDPEVALMLIAGAIFASLLITGKLVPEPMYKREVVRADKGEAMLEKVTAALRDMTEMQKDSVEALKDLTAEVRRK